MKKILFIIWSHSLGGGAETLLTTIVNHLDPAKYQIGIVEAYHSTVKRELVNSKIKIYAPITFEGDTEYQKKLYYIYHEPDRMTRKYIPSGYDLYVSFNYQVPSFLLPNGTKNISWVHGAVWDLVENGLDDYRYLQGKAFEKAAKIVSISDVTTNSIQTLFPEHANKIVEIYNAVNIKKIREKAESFTEIKLRHPSIIYVGRLDENKNPLRMVDIFQQVAKVNSTIHLYFLGKGGLESQVWKKVGEYGLLERVHILGYVDNPFPIMQQADVCCMTSRSEGFPMSLLESVALYVPFVSTAVGGAKILANKERCGRVYATDEEAAEYILEFLGKSREVIKEECEKSIGRFDLNVYISKIEQLFDEVLEKETVSENYMIWNTAEDEKPLENRSYYYHFPEGLILKGSKVILYGAGDIGTNYYNYMKETGNYQVTAWVDAAAEKYRNLGKAVKDIEAILYLEYDVILIAVMHENISRSIRMNLRKMGVLDDKILWVRPIF